MDASRFEILRRKLGSGQSVGLMLGSLYDVFGNYVCTAEYNSILYVYIDQLFLQVPDYVGRCMFKSRKGYRYPITEAIPLILTDKIRPVGKAKADYTSCKVCIRGPEGLIELTTNTNLVKPITPE